MCSHGSILSDNLWGYRVSSQRHSTVADLTTVAGVPEVRTGGRPSKFKKPLNKLIAMRENKGLALEGRNAEAKVLQAEFKAQFPNILCPSLSTIKRYVSEAGLGSKLDQN
jgi:hypothetical protein